MEAAPVQDPFELPSTHKGEVLDHGTPDHGEAPAQRRISTMKIEDGDPRQGPFQWQQSPERIMSLLPPFGASQPSHLPTPQSPGNIAVYLPGPVESPLSPDDLPAGPSRQFSAFIPPSRPASAHPPKTPQRGSSTSASKNVFRPTSRLDSGDNYLSRQPHSQVATPSPEITRTRHASVPNTPSDSETMLSTPNVGKRSSSHPHTGTSVLAPAPIISPANSSHSTVYHASPEFDHPDLETGRTYKFSHGMAALVSEHSISVAEHDQEQNAYDLADPFIARGDEARAMGLSQQRYPSPPISRHHHSATHDNRSLIVQTRAADRESSDSFIARNIISPRDASQASSRQSPVKTEVDEGDYYDVAGAPRSLNDVIPPRALVSPSTPPPVASGRASVTELRTPPLDNSAFRTPPRVAGGEIERIRQRQADLEDARNMESERRRPEYMVRTKRGRDGTDDEAVERERESMLPGLGVTVSPVKGRRLRLYRPVGLNDDPAQKGKHAPESNAVEEPKTPPQLSRSSSTSVPAWQPIVPTMSLRAIDWRTPGRGRSAPIAWTEEEETKKQKRLAAFAAPRASGSGRRLKPVDVPGQGRMIVDVTTDEMRELAEAGILKMPELDTLDDPELTVVNGHGAEWPDDEYPWSLQERQRDDLEEAERCRRLPWIERFLDRESESEEEDNERMAGPSTWNQPYEGSTPSRQRERPSPIPLNPWSVASRRFIKNDRPIPFAAVVADARWALLSKKRVRDVADRVRRREVAEEEEGVVMCVCQGADDGRPMVRCDECRTWYHLVCMDIEDESELGDEWYCWKCVPSAEDPPPAPPSEPTFAPVMPDSPVRASVGDLPFYQSLQPSPVLDIRSRAPVTPSVPSQRNRDPDRSPPRRSRLPHPVGDPDDPVRGGPSTPYQPQSTDSRIYSTPKFYDEYAIDEYAPFDPTSTPSRGLKFPTSIPLTPRRPLSWATPSGPPRTPQFSSQAGSSSTRSLTYSLSTLEDSGGPLTSPWPSEESPTRRPHKQGDMTWPYPPPRRVLDSPLAMRGAVNRPFLPGVEDSPTARFFHRGKDRELGDLTSRAGHGQSPRRE